MSLANKVVLTLSIDHLEGVKARLDTIEEAISQFGSIIADIKEKPSARSQDVPLLPLPEVYEAGDSGSKEGICSQSALENSRHVVNSQYHGSSSLTSLITRIHLSLQEYGKVDDDNPMGDVEPEFLAKVLQDCMAMIEDMARTIEVYGRLDQSNDGRSLVLPPQRLLQAFVKPYFTQVNWMLPVFHQTSFLEKIRQSYELGSEACDAWILCFNNILLQTLEIRALGSPTKSDDHDGTVTEDAMEAELIRPFYANFRRGLSQLERLLAPSLVNVQALISMVCCSSIHDSLCTAQHMSTEYAYNWFLVCDSPGKFPV